MPFCRECGGKLRENSKYCPQCGVEIEKKIEREHHKETHHEIEEKPKHSHHEQPKSSGGAVAAFVIILIIVGIVVVIIFSANEGLFSPGGGIERAIDPCERQFDACNRGCGEGWGSGICKSACSLEYNSCKGS